MSGRKISLVLSDEMSQKVEDYIYETRAGGISNAIRQLVELGLNSYAEMGTPDEPACQTRELSVTESKLLDLAAQLSAAQMDLLVTVAGEFVLADITMRAAEKARETREAKVNELLAQQGLFVTIDEVTRMK